MSKTTVTIDSILGGIAATQYYSGAEQYNSAIAIDPDYPIGTGIKTSGVICPTVYEKFSGANISGYPDSDDENSDNEDDDVESERKSNASVKSSSSPGRSEVTLKELNEIKVKIAKLEAQVKEKSTKMEKFEMEKLDNSRKDNNEKRPVGVNYNPMLSPKKASSHSGQSSSVDHGKNDDKK